MLFICSDRRTTEEALALIEENHRTDDKVLLIHDAVVDVATCSSRIFRAAADLDMRGMAQTADAINIKTIIKLIVAHNRVVVL